MKKLKLITCVIVLLTAIAVLLFWQLRGGNDLQGSGKPSPKAPPFVAATPPTRPTPNTPGSPRPDSIEALLKTPFQLYGIVLDQDGKPVVGVKVDAAVMNNFAEGGTPVSATSDAAGRIEFQMIAAGDHFADIGGYRNPTANIRNLEPIVLDR